MSPFLLTLQTLFTRRALKGHSKSTLRSLQGHSKGNWAINAPEGHLDTWAFKALGHSGSQALKELGLSKDTWTLGHLRHLNNLALRHLGIRVLKEHLCSRAVGYSRHLRHFIQKTQKLHGAQGQTHKIIVDNDEISNDIEIEYGPQKSYESLFQKSIYESTSDHNEFQILIQIVTIRIYLEKTQQTFK